MKKNGFLLAEAGSTAGAECNVGAGSCGFDSEIGDFGATLMVGE